MKAFFSALMFLTRIPLPAMQISKEDWQRSSLYFPVIGLLIGGVLYATSFLFQFLFPPSIVAFFIVLVWIWVTGGLHIDGWMDLADGIGSSRTREEMLVIMKDSRVGAMGVIAAICLLGGKFIATYELLQTTNGFVLLAAPLYARFILIASMRLWSYRKEGGLGAGLQEVITFPILFLHLIWISGATYVLLGCKGILLLVLTSIVGYMFARNIYKKLLVLTGDCYGAIVEWCEVTSLFIAIGIWGNFL